MEEARKAIAVLTERLDNLEKGVSGDRQRLNNNLEKIGLRLDVQTELLRVATHSADSKPSWGITITITTLVGIVVGLATFLFTR